MFHCSECGRGFDRKDTLTRHNKVHDPQRKKPRRKACIPCSTAKIRCLSERPSCSACLRRRVECYYEHPVGQRAPPVSRTCVGPSIDGALDRVPTPIAVDPEQDVMETVLPNAENMRPTAQPQFEVPDSHTTRYDVGADLDPGLYGNWNTTFSSDLDFMNSYSDLRWIFDDAIFSGWPADHSATGVSAAIAPLPDSSAYSMGKASPEGQPQSRNTGAALQDKLITLVAPKLLQSSASKESWPILWQPEAGKSDFVLPSLGDNISSPSVQRKFFAIQPVTDVTRTALYDALQLPFEHAKSKTANLDNWPESSKLDYCIDQYFAHFHPMVSIVHQATFNPQEELLVTLAIITVGSAYTKLKGAHAFQVALCDLLRRLLVFVGEHDRRLARTEPYLIAQLLQGMMGYCVGNAGLFELSEANRGVIIYNAKCMGLFSNEAFSLDNTMNFEALRNQWQTWIRQERRCRLGWAVFEFDASASYLHNVQPRLNLADVRIALPSSLDLWQAESAHTWALSYSQTAEQGRLDCLPPLIKRLYDGSESPTAAIEDDKHRLLVLLALMTKLWSLRGFGFSVLPSSVRDHLDDARCQILKGIDRFNTSLANAGRTKTRVEMIRAVHQVKLVHMAHLSAAGDLMSFLYPFLRKGTESERAQARMLDWAAEDPKRYREVIYSSAQMLNLLRQYPSNMPSEPFLIFHAGVILSCMAQVPCNESGSEPGEIVRIDNLSGLEDQTEIAEWLAYDGRGVALHGVPSLRCDEGRRQVLDQTAELLKRRATWRISQNLAYAVIALRDEDHNLQDHQAALSN